MKTNQNKKPLLKVIGGAFKGRNIKMAPLEITRSSKAILKESLFNTLNQEVVLANFVEFFAGSGSIGIEALSRGAKSAIFFEQNKETCRILEENLQNICQGCHYRIVFGDTFEKYQEALKGLDYLSIGYFDPPFDIREGMTGIYQKCFKMIEKLDTKVFGIVILEHISSLEIPQLIGNFKKVKTKKFGKSSLSYFVA